MNTAPTRSNRTASMLLALLLAFGSSLGAAEPGDTPGVAEHNHDHAGDLSGSRWNGNPNGSRWNSVGHA